MPTNAEFRPESDRIQFLLNRDGFEATRAWIRRTHGIYREAVRQADSMYRPRFEQAIREFEEWLATERT